MIMRRAVAAIAHRTPSLTLRASFGIAPQLRTAVNRGLPDRQLTAGWGQWDQWLATIDIVPFGFTGLVEGRLEQLDLGADTAIGPGPLLLDRCRRLARGTSRRCGAPRSAPPGRVLAPPRIRGAR